MWVCHSNGQSVPTYSFGLWNYNDLRRDDGAAIILSLIVESPWSYSNGFDTIVNTREEQNVKVRQGFVAFIIDQRSG